MTIIFCGTNSSDMILLNWPERLLENTALSNDEQRNVYNTVMGSVRNDKGETLFVHSAGGGGKTFVCNTVAAAVREMGKVALCGASSGISSLLLDGG
jgi:hypothetical protein